MPSLSTYNSMIHINKYNYEEYLSASINQENDSYNNYGLNISAQQRRQKMINWTTIIYKKS